MPRSRRRATARKRFAPALARSYRPASEGDRDAPGSLAPDNLSTPANHADGRRGRLRFVRGASSVSRSREVLMRKRLVFALVAFLPLLILVPPARAQVPAPKVTIT